MKKIMIRILSLVMIFLLLLNTAIDVSGVSLNGNKVFAATPQWVQKADISGGIQSHESSALHDGSVFLTGGNTSLGFHTNSTYLYNPQTNQWVAKASLPKSLYQHSQSILNDEKVLVCGGYSSSASSDCYIYNPDNDSWSTAASLPEGIQNHTQSTLNDGRVLLSGGYGSSSGYAGKTYIYSPSSNSWSSAISLPVPLYHHAQTTLKNGNVIVAGGYNTSTNNVSNAVYLYNPISNIWTSAASLPVALRGLSISTLLDGKVLVTGGDIGSGGVNTAYIYDPLSNTWASSVNLPQSLSTHSQCTLSNGNVLVTGGYNGSSVVSTTYQIQLNQNPIISISTPEANSLYTANSPSLVPKITLSDPDNDPITCKLYLNSETTARETKTISSNTATPQEITFGAINTSLLPEGTHTVKFEVSDGNAAINKTVDFKVDRSPPVIGAVNIKAEVDKISVSGDATEPISGLVDYPFQYSIDQNTSAWFAANKSTIVSNVINSLYDTSGNGGRKLVRLSNGWFVAVARNASGHLYFYKSTDNGNTWAQACYYTYAATNVAITSYGTNIYAIVSAENAGTNILVKFDVTTQVNTNLTVASYPESVTQIKMGSGGVSISTDSTGNLHAAWTSRSYTYLNSYNIRYSKSTDGGATWATPTQITDINNDFGNCRNPCVVIHSNGNPNIIFGYNAQDGTHRIANTYWDGSSWNINYARIYNGGQYGQYNPCAVVDNYGHIHVAWHGVDSIDNNYQNIRYSKSTDNGATWSAPIKLTSGNSYNQEKPTITTDKSGKVYVYWQGIDPAISPTYYNIRRTVSGGSSWSAVETVTNNTTNNALNPSLCDNYKDFSSPLYIYQDQQANAVKYSGSITMPPQPFEVTGLLPNTPHQVTFKAKDKAGNISTHTQTVYTKAVQPTLTTLEASGTSISLKVNDTNPKDTQYQISCGERYVNAFGEITTDAVWIKIPSKNITVTGLDNKLKYSFNIKARNGNGIETTSSDAITASIGSVKPAIPQNIKAQPKSKSITLTWDEVPGAASYDVEADGVVHNVVNNLYFTHTGLIPETSHVYRIRVRAGTGADEKIGEWSEEIVSETLKDIPPVVTNLTAAKTSTTASLSWSPVSGGGVVYEVQADGKIIRTGFETEYLHKNLPVNSRHTYRVRAVNSAGAGAWSNPVTITTGFVAPTIPLNINGVGSKTKIVVTWNKVTDATNYLIEFKCNDPNMQGTIIDNKGNNYRVIYGSPASTYYLRIKAKNPAGESEWSSVVTVMTYALETPEFELIEESQTEVTLKWGAVPDAKTYSIERNGTVVGTTSELTYKDIGLTPETKYSYRIKAVSLDNKESNWSYAAEAITLPEKPPVPDDFYASGANGMVSLSWKPVVGAIAYDLEIDGVIIENGNKTEYLYKDIAPKTEHFYRVRARNSGIEGDWHAGIRLTTLPDTIQPPMNINVATTNTVTTVKWEKVTDAVRYEVEVNGVIVYNGTRNEFVHRRLDPNIEHKYRIRSFGHVDISEWSSLIVNNAVTLVCDKGKNAQIGLTASDVTDFSGYTLTVTYNKDVLSVDDLCTLTSDKELTVGKIKGTDVEVIGFEPGKITFKVDKPIELGMSWSGIINRIGFKGKVTGGTTITYTVFIEPKKLIEN